MIRVLLSAFALVLGLAAGGAQAATVTASGVSNLQVGSNFYNVQFLDTSCTVAWAPCTATSNFTFQSATAVTAAMTALGNAVSASGSFDVYPTLINGCDFTKWCYIQTPYSVVSGQIMVGYFYNEIGGGIHNLVGTAGPGSATSDLSTIPTAVYAKWTPVTVSPVPLPASAWLLGLGFGALAAAGMRRRKVA